MVFDIDLHSTSSIAAIDDQGHQVTYGEVCSFCEEVALVLSQRELIFCLCENSVGALLGYIAFYENKDVSLLLNSKIEDGLLDNLLEIYSPGYIWCPVSSGRFNGGEIVLRKDGYILVKTDHERYAMHSDLSLLLTTSGTTGSPKLVRYRYGNLESNAMNVAEAFSWTAQERGICDLPMQYTMGLNVINSHLVVGATLLLISNNLMSPVFWRFIQENKGSNFTGVPYSYEILLKLKLEKMSLPYLMTFAEGGGKLSNEKFKLLTDYAERNDKRFIATFGTTETSARMALLSPDKAKEKIGSIGRAIPHVELFLVNEEGAVISKDGEEGELCCRGTNVTMGYALCKEDLAKGDEFCGVYKTGDIALRDSDGYYYIVGRKKRFLKIFGLRVSLDQCERLIDQKFNTECVCKGTDEQMTIFITEDDLSELVINYLAQKTNLPKSCFKVKVIPCIPRNESGKIKYNDLMI